MLELLRNESSKAQPLLSSALVWVLGQAFPQFRRKGLGRAAAAALPGAQEQLD